MKTSDNRKADDWAPNHTRNPVPLSDPAASFFVKGDGGISDMVSETPDQDFTDKPFIRNAVIGMLLATAAIAAGVLILL
jgi:hypothetical protein